jgi:hypothetical protein
VHTLLELGPNQFRREIRTLNRKLAKYKREHPQHSKLVNREKKFWEGIVKVYNEKLDGNSTTYDLLVAQSKNFEKNREFSSEFFLDNADNSKWGPVQEPSSVEFLIAGMSGFDAVIGKWMVEGWCTGGLTPEKLAKIFEGYDTADKINISACVIACTVPDKWWKISSNGGSFRNNQIAAVVAALPIAKPPLGKFSQETIDKMSERVEKMVGERVDRKVAKALVKANTSAIKMIGYSVLANSDQFDYKPTLMKSLNHSLGGPLTSDLSRIEHTTKEGMSDSVSAENVAKSVEINVNTHQRFGPLSEIINNLVNGLE